MTLDWKKALEWVEGLVLPSYVGRGVGNDVGLEEGAGVGAGVIVLPQLSADLAGSVEAVLWELMVWLQISLD